MSIDCSQFNNTVACDGMVCNTDWTKAATAQNQMTFFCKPLTGQFAACGTTCSLTHWGTSCCSASDWQTCFENLSKNGCANGGSNGLTVTHALGSTSAITTISGHALSTSNTVTVSMTTSATATHTSASASTSSHSSTAQMTGTSTSSSNPYAPTSSAERHIGFGSKLAVCLLSASFFANLII